MSEHQPEQNNPNEPDNDHGDSDNDAPDVEAHDNSPFERIDKMRDGPRIWVGSLADYNNGNLHGEWIDAAVDPEVLARAVQHMLARSNEPDAEEYGIFDYDNFGSFRVH